jgi:hypothetical protein
VPWEKAPPVNGLMYPSLMFRINGVDIARAGPAAGMALDAGLAGDRIDVTGLQRRLEEQGAYLSRTSPEAIL